MTENKAVERMARELRQAVHPIGTSWGGCSDREKWLRAARLALTSHPAVESLRELIEAHDTLPVIKDGTKAWIDASLRLAQVEYRARTVLASLPKEK